MTGVIANPLLGILPKLKRPAPGSAPDAARDHETLVALAQTVIALIGGGEHHEESVGVTATKIPHRLGRKPSVLIWTAPPEENTSDVWVPAPGILALWTDQHIVLQAAKASTVRFVLL